MLLDTVSGNYSFAVPTGFLPDYRKHGDIDGRIQYTMSSLTTIRAKTLISYISAPQGTEVKMNPEKTAA